MQQQPQLIAALEANKNAREQAENLLALVDELVDGVRPLSMPRFWETVAALAAARVGMVLVEDGPSQPKAMNEHEAMEFEASLVPMGKYKDMPVHAVDIRYWLVITENDFYRKLRRYLRSERFARRQ